MMNRGKHVGRCVQGLLVGTILSCTDGLWKPWNTSVMTVYRWTTTWTNDLLNTEQQYLYSDIQLKLVILHNRHSTAKIMSDKISESRSSTGALCKLARKYVYMAYNFIRTYSGCDRGIHCQAVSSVSSNEAKSQQPAISRWLRGGNSCGTMAENMGHRLLFNGKYGISSHCMTFAWDVAGIAWSNSGITVESDVKWTVLNTPKNGEPKITAM